MSYNIGDLVYYPGNVTGRVFQSLINNNGTTPALTAPTYDVTIVYNPGDFVTSSSVVYKSLWPTGDNVGNTPVSSPLYWQSIPAWSNSTSYNLGDTVIYNDVLYISLVGSNLGHQVDVSPTYWQLLQSNLALGSWLLLDASLVPVVNPAALYPGSSVFPLPNGFLRAAPQNPKDGSYSLMGSPTNAAYKDWLYEGPYIISMDGTPPSAFRFVADVTDTTLFDSMFVEGFAARIAEEICETVTQSTDKLTKVENAYNTVMKEARLVNGIENGSEEAPMDDYLTTRY